MLRRVTFGKLVSAALVPLVFSFSTQGALEVFHPLEELNQSGHLEAPHHTHLWDGPVWCGILQSDAAPHSSHACLHLNAFAPHPEATLIATASLVWRTAPGGDRSPRIVTEAPTLGRGPPLQS